MACVQAKCAELDVAQRELEERHSRVQQLESVKEWLERELKDAQVITVSLTLIVADQPDNLSLDEPGLARCHLSLIVYPFVLHLQA